MHHRALLLVPGEPPGTPGYPVVWPAGTRWQADLPLSSCLAAASVPLRGRESGGGFVQPDDLPSGVGAAVVEAGAGYVADSGEVALLDPGSEVTPPDPAG